MENSHENSQMHGTDKSNVGIAELITLFEVADIKLHQCAAHKPGIDEGMDAEIAQQEREYFNQQDKLLKSALELPIKSQDDIKNVLRLWQKKYESYGHDTRLSDKLILALCAHYKLI